MKSALTASFAGILMAVAMPVWAHHSFAKQYDAAQKVKLTGVVTKVEWMNPHARFYMDVKDESGKVTNWNLELASPNVLARMGWSRHSLKPGDQITVEGARARDGSKHMANARVVTLADGKRVFARAK